MKYLDSTSLSRINGFLDHVDVGDYVVHGNLEAYSCKLAGLDKKLSRSLEASVAEGASPSSMDLGKSPMGPLTEATSRKTLIYLILTLNHIYPDYDFSLLRAHHFRKEAGAKAVEAATGAVLMEVARVWAETPGYGGRPFMDALWAALDEAIGLSECDVYSYKSDGEDDPFGEAGNIWSFNYFLYNRKQKRVLYFSCRGVSKTAASDDEYSFDSDDEDPATRYGMATDMEL
mmetsp:Transcript_11354/g.34118  ORF Transcript_11354/g.34118 Transcript_11354/m.34118 type:complete len:231 (-) Transcript_11354:966-1658(-)